MSGKRRHGWTVSLYLDATIQKPVQGLNSEAESSPDVFMKSNSSDELRELLYRLILVLDLQFSSFDRRLDEGWARKAA